MIDDDVHFFGQLEGTQAYLGVPPFEEVAAAACSKSRRVAIPLATSAYGRQHVTMVELTDIEPPMRTSDGGYSFAAVWRELMAYPLHAHDIETTFTFRVYVRTCLILINGMGRVERIAFSDAEVGIEDATLVNAPESA